MKILKCEDCGELEFAILDGYVVGETLLEGVKFKICAKEKGVSAEPLTEEDKTYLKTLNAKRWIGEAARFGAGYDNLECPKCHQDGGIVFWERR